MSKTLSELFIRSTLNVNEAKILNDKPENSKSAVWNWLVSCHVGVFYTMKCFKVSFTPLIMLDLDPRSFLCSKSGPQLHSNLIRVVHTSCQLRNLRSTQTEQAVSTAAGRRPQVGTRKRSSAVGVSAIFQRTGRDVRRPTFLQNQVGSKNSPSFPPTVPVRSYT